MMAAIPALALLCAVGTSHAQTPPGEVVNNQIQLGDVFSSQTLDVVEVSEGVSAETAATGNNLVGSTEGANLTITSNQTMAGSAIASTMATVTTGLGAVSQINTIAIGNAVEAGTTEGVMVGVYTQIATAAPNVTASGNVVAAVNEGVLLDVTTTQFNQSYVRAQAEGSAYEFGEGAATAYAVGNSTLAGNSGEAVVLENVQLNTGGGVEAIASFSGEEGYDGYSRATAVGNDVTGYACATCYGSMTIGSTQTNSADVGATSTTTVGSGRLINSTSTAVGNNASFYVTRPGGP